MNQPPPTTRRDPRFSLGPGRASVRFADPHADGFASGEVVAVSAAGVALVLDGQAVEFPAGTNLESVVLRLGECVLAGEAVVRNARDLDPGRVEVGCVFYPSPSEEDRWMTLLAGIELGAVSSGDDR